MEHTVGRILKNWAERQAPPRSRRDSLLRAAAQSTWAASGKKAVWLLRLTDPSWQFRTHRHPLDWPELVFTRTTIHVLTVGIACSRMVS